MTQEKLNEKLAKWANCKVKVIDWQRTTALCSQAKQTEDGYAIPCEIEDYTELVYPDFTDSLDSCFMVLVPKLDYMCLQNEDNGFYADVSIGEKYAEYYGAETPALALCFAIEKLIDTQNE